MCDIPAGMKGFSETRARLLWVFVYIPCRRPCWRRFWEEDSPLDSRCFPSKGSTGCVCLLGHFIIHLRKFPSTPCPTSQTSLWLRRKNVQEAFLPWYFSWNGGTTKVARTLPPCFEPCLGSPDRQMCHPPCPSPSRWGSFGFVQSLEEIKPQANCLLSLPRSFG